MTAKILDGKALASNIKDALKREVQELNEQTGHVPALINIMIGKDSGSCAYANSQKKVAGFLGIEYKLKELPEDISHEALLQNID